jgi:hypothetical protein
MPASFLPPVTLQQSDQLATFYVKVIILLLALFQNITPSRSNGYPFSGMPMVENLEAEREDVVRFGQSGISLIW